jgi:hypothetical protein
MSVAHDLIIDPLSPPAVDGEKHLATWYTQGHSDGLGDRLLMFDNTSAPSWEILRFKPELARDVRFEAALRARIDQLASFKHPAFPIVRPLKGLGHEDGLAVVSTYAPGLPLSEAMKRPRSAAFAVRLLRQLAPAVAGLQSHAPGMYHGALDIDRIVVTADGRLTIREHMVGSAIAALERPAIHLWTDFRIIAGSSAAPVPEFDCRTDVIQLGLVVVSLMAGHRIVPDEYPDRIEGLLDEIGERNGRESLVLFQSLRYWIERALQLDEYMFDSARDANEALAELRGEASPHDDYATAIDPMRQRPQLISGGRIEDAIKSAPAATGIAIEDGVIDSADTIPAENMSRSIRVGHALKWAAAAAALAAIVEAVFIGRLLYTRAATPPAVLVAAAPIPSVALPAVAVASTGSTSADITAPAESKGTTMKVPSASIPPPAPPKTGGFRLTSSIQLHVLDNERVLGSSTDGPIVVAAGKHEYEFVNSAIGYRVRRAVDIKAGQITQIAVNVPNGTLNVNAVPWASVWVDGNPVGETPLGNLSVPPGEHEITFRHPQLGERREKALVRSDTPTRVTVNFAIKN